MFSYLFIGVSKTVHVLHNSEHPASVFSILDTGTKQIPLVADGLFDVLMLKMTPVYTSKKQTKVWINEIKLILIFIKNIF